MNRAEHSPPNPSAPHGAFQAVNSVSSTSSPLICHRGQNIQILEISPRRAASSRALIAILALGLGAASHQAQAAPSFRFMAPPALPASSKTARATQTKAATSMVRRAAFASAPRLHLMPRAVSISAPNAINVKTVKATSKPASKTAVFAPDNAAPRFPSAASALKIAQGLQREMALLSAKSSAPQVARKVQFATFAAKPKFSTTAASGAKVIRFAPAAPIETFVAPRPKPAFVAISSPLSPLTPARLKPDLSGMKKVIDASSLSLPPLSQPLPTWMQSATVKIDRVGAKTPKRFAQNPGAAPIRNPSAPVTNSDRLANQIEVATSTFVVLLTTTDLQTVAIADPSIADVAVVNSRSVLLNGKNTGVTSLVIVDGQKIRQYTVRVTASPGSRAVDIAGAIGIPGVTVRPLKDALVLEGEVGNAEEARRATEIAGIYATKVVNQLSIRGQVSQEAGSAAQLRDLIGLPGVNVRVSGETAILSGIVDTTQQIQDADQIARTAAKNVINQLRLPPITPQQVRESLGAVAEAPVAGLYNPGQLQTSAPLSVREAGGQLVLEGTVASQGDVDIALAAAGRTGLPIVNRIQVRAGATADQAFVSQVVAAIGRPGIIVRGTPKRLVLEGTVNDTNEAVLAEQVARSFVLASIGQVDNMLRTQNPLQCNVDVAIIEINSTDARNLGVEYGSSTLLSENFTAGVPATVNPVTGVQTAPGTPGGTTRTVDPAFKPGVGLLGRRFGGLGATQILDPLQARINALATQGKARILSNPRTTVLSGRTATFQVGGQVPIPSGSTTNAAGTSTSITFKDYGILLDIVPNALRNGNVTLRVRTEVSQPDFGVAVTPAGGGGPIPGFSRRSTITEVTVPIGGTVALSGLIQADESVTTTSVPILSKIPIIGSLFRSKNFRNNQSELVIFVKPRVLENPLTNNSDAFAGVVAVGENSNIAAQMGNPGLRTFDSGAAVGGGGVGAAGGAQ